MICKRCLLTEYHRNVSFDKRNICNFCVSYDRNKKRLTDFPKLKKKYTKRVEDCRKKGVDSKYDCIVPLSGGKDSSYILYHMKKDYNLRILAVTCENWFSNKTIKRSAIELCKNLKVDCIYYKPDWEIVRRIYSVLFKHTGSICLGCMGIIWVKIFKTALEQKIPAIIIGESRDQMMSGKFYFDAGLIKDNFDNIVNFGGRNFFWKEYYSKFFKEIDIFINDYFPGNSEVSEIFEFPFKNIKNADVPDVIPYFFFNEHNEKRIVHELEKKLGWNNFKKTGFVSHADCLFHKFMIHPFADIWSLSVYIREGTVSRNEAFRDCLDKMHNYIKQNPNIQLEKILARLKLNKNEIRNKKWYKKWSRHGKGQPCSQ